MKFRVIQSHKAKNDLVRLTDVLLERAQTAEDLDRALLALETLQGSIAALADSALRCRKAGGGSDPFLRELVIPFDSSGYMALFGIVGDAVVVAAVRRELEDDYQ